jgi:hypothetical protein
MGTDNPVDWAAALADVEARIAKLQIMADNIREFMAASGVTPAGPGGGGKIRPDSFLKMSIPDATKKLLEMARVKQSTQEVMDALEKGGLPPSKYNTVYSILARRATQVGDIINMKGDWALAEWYPNHRPTKSKKSDASVEAEESGGEEKPEEKATA